MTAQALEQQTYLPGERETLAEIHSFIEAHEQAHGIRPEPRYLLAGAEEHENVEIPKAVFDVLRQVVEAMNAGRAVTVAPQSQKLTTQQAADLLGVSRPTVVKLIDEGTLPAETPAKRRRLLRLEDVLEYRRRRREEQYRAIFATSEPDEFEEDAEVMAALLKQARAEAAERRRSVS